MMSNQHLKEIFSNNLKRYMNRDQISPAELSRRLDIPETTFNNWINAKTYPRIDKIQLIADYFSIRKSDLQEEKASNIYPVTEFINIPVLGRIACGDPIDAEQNVSEYRPVVADHVPHGELFFVEAAGDSMEPKIPDGSYVLCRKQEDVETGEIAAVLVNGDEETTLKKVIKQGDTILLQPLNEDYAPYIITKDNPGRIVGKAISVEMML